MSCIRTTDGAFTAFAGMLDNLSPECLELLIPVHRKKNGCFFVQNAKYTLKWVLLTPVSSHQKGKNMRRTLLFKFILTYIVIGIMGFLGITNISYTFDFRNLVEATTDNMYKQAVTISREYASVYFSNDKLKLIQTQLATISSASDERIMFISVDGTIILDSDNAAVNPDTAVILNTFDYTATGNQYSQTGNFYGFFHEPVISVMAPITSAFSTKGYVAIHTPVSAIREQVYITFNTNYISFSMMMALALAFIIVYFTQIHTPLAEIINGVNSYGRGDLSYHIKVTGSDELGSLGASLNYMAGQLKELDQFQQKFISNISHDFRSPLTSIKGYLEAMADGTIPPEMMNKYINILLFETERLTKLTNNILTLNELDPKSVRLDKTTFDINNIIRHTIETFEGACKEKNITFKLIFSAKRLDVYADCGKIQQVIYNLVDNAIKFSSPNSTIFISSTDRNGKAYISVKDTGVGIPKQNCDKIFDRFYKSDASRGRDKKGSGLGLAIVKEILQAHGENIDVISTEGVGTEFVFTLKKARNKQA